jgi:hypothetical protein
MEELLKDPILISGTLALGVAISSLIFLTTSKEQKISPEVIITSEMQKRINTLEIAIANLQARTNNFGLIGGSGSSNEDARFLDLQKRMKSLEDAISTTPDKALSIPLLKKDLEAIQRSFSDYNLAAKAELERLYDFNKWFFGLIATMALSVLGLVYSTIKGMKEDKKNKNPDAISKLD